MPANSPLRIIFAGTPDFAAEALKELLAADYTVVAVYTQPDRPAGRGRKLKASPVKEVALAHEIPVFQPESLKGESEQAELASLGADLMVVAAYGLLLPKAVLESPRLGCINIHASLLPRWRGAAPIQRAILAGDAETGITIMQMDEGLDTGDMLLKLSTPIESVDTGGSLHDRLAALGGRALLQALDQLQAGTLHGEPQDDALANYARKLNKAEAELDWTLPAVELLRKVRAFNPWPVAQTQLDGQTLRVWQAEQVDGAPGGAPGTVVQAGKHGIEVATAAGRLRITQLQPPGKRPMGAADFLNARSLDGVVLGNG